MTPGAVGPLGGLLYPPPSPPVTPWVCAGPAEGLVQSILADLRLERPGRSPQHHLVLGPVGAGKSAALGRLAAAVAGDAELARVWVPVVLAGPHLELGGVLDLWRSALRGLGLEGQARSVGDAEAARVAVSSALEARGGRRLLLVIDEVDAVFERLTASGEEWALRESVSHGRDVLLVAASSRPVAATYEYGRAFYDFFRVRELALLDEAGALGFARALAEAWGARSVSRVVREQPQRLAAVRLLLARTARSVAQLVALWREDARGGVCEDLARLLDRVTPEVRAALGALPAQGQRVVGFLGRAWGPQTARCVAQGTGLTINAASAQLSRLAQQGVVAKVALPDTKRMGFLLADRVVSLWLLWRAGGAQWGALEALAQEAAMVCASASVSSEAAGERPPGPAPRGLLSVPPAPRGLLSVPPVPAPPPSQAQSLAALEKWLAKRPRSPWTLDVWHGAAPVLAELVAAERASEAATALGRSPRGAAWRGVAAWLAGPGAGREPPEVRAVANRVAQALGGL